MVYIYTTYTNTIGHIHKAFCFREQFSNDRSHQILDEMNLSYHKMVQFHYKTLNTAQNAS